MRIPDKASSYSIHDYGKVRFTADYLWDYVDRRMKRRRLPDVGWERYHDVVSRLTKLVSKGRRILKIMLDAVLEAHIHWLEG